MKPILCLLVAILMACSAHGQTPKPASKPKLVARLEIAADGSVRVFHTDGAEVVVPKEKDQASSESTGVAEGGEAAGWLATFEGCCQSYAIPTMLVVYRPGMALRRFGDGRFLAGWVFVNDPKQVAFCSTSAHGNPNPHYELRDIETGRLLEEWNGPTNEKTPKWVHWIAADQ
jgi:hypothetical protein